MRDMATLRAIAADPAFAAFAQIEEPYLSYRHVVASLAWAEVYVEDGKVVSGDGPGGYESAYDEFVKDGGLLERLLK